MAPIVVATISAVVARDPNDRPPAICVDSMAPSVVAMELSVIAVEHSVVAMVLTLVAMVVTLLTTAYRTGCERRTGHVANSPVLSVHYRFRTTSQSHAMTSQSHDMTSQSQKRSQSHKKRSQTGMIVSKWREKTTSQSLYGL